MVFIVFDKFKETKSLKRFEAQDKLEKGFKTVFKLIKLCNRSKKQKQLETQSENLKSLGRKREFHQENEKPVKLSRDFMKENAKAMQI